MERLSPERLCERIAATQYGLITLQQALAAGLRDHQIEWRVRSGRWVRFAPGVFVINGAPSSWHQRLLGTCLSIGPDAVASHRSAGALWDLDGTSPGVVEVAVPRKVVREGVIVHRLASVARHVSKRACIPATDPTTTILDLAAVLDDFSLEKAVDSAVRMKLTCISLLRARLEERARQGRNGVRRMRRLLDVRDPSHRPHESGLEVRFARFVRAFHLPCPRPQFVLKDDGGADVGRFDFAYPEARVAIELQSYRHHHDRVQWEKDQLRSAVLSSIDWLFVPVTDRQMATDPDGLAQRLRRILDLRSRD